MTHWGMSSFTSALSFQPVPSPVGPASPPSSVGLRFRLRVAPSHKDGAIWAELPAGRIHQPGHRLTAQHWVRHLFDTYCEWLPASQHSGKPNYIFLCIYLHHPLSVSIETSSEWAWPSQGTRRRYSLPSRRSGYTKLHPPCFTDQSQPGHGTTLKMTLTLSTIAPDPACSSDQWERFKAWNTNWCSFNQPERRNEMTSLWRARWTSGFLLPRLAEPHPEVTAWFF